MKTIIIPEKAENTISIAETTCSNLVIVKENNKIVGFLVYDGNEWGFQYSSDTSDIECWDNNLFEVIKSIQKFHPTYTFFVED